MIIEIAAPLQLFRYDISEPPTSWDASLHCFHTEHFEKKLNTSKNKIGAYFLYDNMNAALAVADVALRKKQLSDLWFTKTSTTSSIRILDFSKCSCIHEMLDVLEALGIDVCNVDFKIHGKNRTLVELVNHTYDSKIFPEFPHAINLAYLGQCITDFDNGLHFNQSLINAELCIDGYRWCETINPYALTYCLFSNEYLNPPNTNKNELMK